MASIWTIVAKELKFFAQIFILISYTFPLSFGFYLELFTEKITKIWNERTEYWKYFHFLLQFIDTQCFS